MYDNQSLPNISYIFLIIISFCQVAAGAILKVIIWKTIREDPGEPGEPGEIGFFLFTLLLFFFFFLFFLLFFFSSSLPTKAHP